MREAVCEGISNFGEKICIKKTERKTKENRDPATPQAALISVCF